jgi:hypothetical protein
VGEAFPRFLLSLYACRGVSFGGREVGDCEVVRDLQSRVESMM